MQGEGSPCGSVVKNPSANARDSGSIPGLGRLPGGGNGNTLHYSCLENSVGSGDWRSTVHGVAKESDMTDLPKCKRQIITQIPCKECVIWHLCEFVTGFGT